MTGVDTPRFATPSLDDIRACFPALASSTAFFENAGGSQLPLVVIDAVRNYLTECNVNTGAPYAISERATLTIQKGREFLAALLNAESARQVIVGQSTTQLLDMLSNCFAPLIEPGDEIIVSVANHEANIGPWLRLERFGAKVLWWPLGRNAETLDMDALPKLLGNRPKIVAVPHVSNLLGDIVDLPEIVRQSRIAGARVVVDGVAYASHLPMDVRKWSADWYVFSAYKVFGPHFGVLYGSPDAMEQLDGPNHFFIGKSEGGRKFELGVVSHEGIAGMLALSDYFAFLAGASQYSGRSTVEAAYASMQRMEAPLTTRLLDAMRSIPDIRIVGLPYAGTIRVPTISFVHGTISPSEISARCARAGIAMRHGHMYAYRLCQAAGIAPEPGVARVSMLHYNTAQEVDRLVSVLESL